MGGMVSRVIALDHAERVDALVLMDTTPGPIPGFDPELIEVAVDVAFNQGKPALKELLEFARTLETPAHLRTLAERPGYLEFCDAKWHALSVVMWGALARELAHQADDLPRFSTIGCPALVIVGEQDEPFLGPSRAMADAIPDARLVVVRDAGHSPQFEQPSAWIDALTAFLSTLVPAAS
jgi:pimeloyl-ACP methyl ester carboxylesterase